MLCLAKNVRSIFLKVRNHERTYFLESVKNKDKKFRCRDTLSLCFMTDISVFVKSLLKKYMLARRELLVQHGTGNVC